MKRLITLCFCTTLFIAPVKSQLTVTPVGWECGAVSAASFSHSALWFDPNINSLAFVYRGGLDTNYCQKVSYNFSLSGGTNWHPIGFVRIYNNLSSANSLYPHVVIYNPTGNTTPQNAYISHFTQTWGQSGVAYGSGPLGNTSSAAYTQTNVFNNVSGLNHFQPDAFIITQQGKTFNVDLMRDTAGNYLDSLILSKGIWNGTNDFNYTAQKIFIPADMFTSIRFGTHKAMLSSNIAFANDGRTGYITVMAHQNFLCQPDSVYNPIIYKTIDSGATWSLIKQLDLDNVDVLFGSPGKHYSAHKEFDNVVDANGNLHIVCSILPFVTTDSVDFTPSHWGIFDVFTTDGGVSWFAKLLAEPLTFNGNWVPFSSTNPSFASYSRPQASINWDATKIFFSWIDTDTLAFGTTENTIPDIHALGYNVVTNLWTPEINVTKGTDADGFCTFFKAAHYYKDNGVGGTLHFVYAAPLDVTQITGMDYEYIKADFVNLNNFVNLDSGIPLGAVCATANNEIEPGIDKTMIIYPNPTNGSFNLIVNKKVEGRQVSIFNVVGECVFNEKFNGSRKINCSLPPGIYFLRLQSEGIQSVQKLIIE